MYKILGLQLSIFLVSAALVMIIAFGISSKPYSFPNTTIISSADATPLLLFSSKVGNINSNPANNNHNSNNNITKSSPNIFPNVKTSFISNTIYPHVDHSAYIHPI